MENFTSRKFLAALFLSVIGVLFVLMGKLEASDIWIGLSAIWGAYGVLNVLDKKLNN